MRISNCPYCNGILKTGVLVYRYNFRLPKIIFEDGTEKRVNASKPLKDAVINEVFYCDKCKVMLADLSFD